MRDQNICLALVRGQKKGHSLVLAHKRVVYFATCKECSKSDAPASYVGETARQLGERAHEHMTKAKSLNKDSFIVNHWMEKHHLDTSPPGFKFSVLSSHRDPLSRQLREAILIGKQGDLNKKNEFGLNELIRLDAPHYSWDKAERDRLQRKEKLEHDIKICDFTAVMLNVKECDRNVIVPNEVNGDFCYRHSFKRQREECNNKVTVWGEEEHRGRKKKRKMFTSTPKTYREAPQYKSDDSGATMERSMSLEVSDNVLQEEKQTRTNVSGKWDETVKDDSKAPKLMQALGDKIIQVDNYCDATESFSTRQSNKGGTGGFRMKLSVMNNDTNAMEQDDVNTSLSAWEEGFAVDPDVWEDDYDLGLSLLFNELVETEDGYDDFGLTDLFHEKIVDQYELKECLKEMKSNKLYSIFKASVVKMTPTKRKISPNSHGSSSKTRRMSLEQTTSPKLRPITDNMTRGRSATVTSPSVEKRTKKRASRRLIPGQQLLTRIWGKLARTIIYVVVPATPTRHLVWSLSGLI